MAKNPQIIHMWHDSEATGKDFLFQIYDRMEIKCDQPIQVITTFRGLSVSTKSSPLRTGGGIYQTNVHSTPFVKTKKQYKLGLSWAKLSSSWDWALLQLICIA